MICNKCNNEFTNINGLKFCPYCGWEIETFIDMEVEQTPNIIPDKINNGESESIAEEDAVTIKHEDTLPMPAITEEDIKKYNRHKFFSSFKKPDINLKVIIPIIALLFVIVGGVFAYTVFIIKPVDEVGIKEDLVGKVITLPKGTSIKISTDYIKSFSINSRNTDKNNNKDEIKVALTLNDGVIEANTLLSLVYTYEGNNQWKISDTLVLEGVTSVKPVIGMDEEKFLNGLKKLSINIADTPLTLGGQEVKSLGINLRTLDLENGKEDILVQASIDSGILATTGKIKCKVVFENEAWRISTIEENSTEDFILVLSPTFSNEKVIEAIRKKGLQETVVYPDFFGGKGFTVKDSFTKSIEISDKKFDKKNGQLSVVAKRENVAGKVKSVLLTNYIFSTSLSDISLLKASKTTVDSGTISNVSNEIIISTIANSEIEGSNLLFWWSDNHKITSEEVKTFKTKEIYSNKGFENIKYVYGSIAYIDRKKQKSVSFIAIYFLVYDGDKGYNWKLNKVIGEDSPNYKTYSKKVKK